jgi:hypothetical protein
MDAQTIVCSVVENAKSMVNALTHLESARMDSVFAVKVAFVAIAKPLLPIIKIAVCSLYFGPS